MDTIYPQVPILVDKIAILASKQLKLCLARASSSINEVLPQNFCPSVNNLILAAHVTVKYQLYLQWNMTVSLN
jgi:hypothetical protein